MARSCSRWRSWPKTYLKRVVAAHDLRLLLRIFTDHKGKPMAVILDSRALRSTPESGARAGYDGAKRGFILLPRRWVVERSFAWAARFRRLVRDYERLPEALKGLHFVACACLMLNKVVAAMLSS